ncbi:Uncharacterized protein C2orf42 [Araneus ventricosus]|uniref:Uncharacterized protein C2orf42 n=1 Tax=Araneus ventricosus TaxID=182803 RepID=A0A4Y2GFB3_ARAVE|nr:Uncharacterized protein C2orf42 [Araneus ventricosus]
MTDKSKNLFEDLGKPTLRGVRKCPKCGTYNGTRGLSCKNKECKLVFKMGKEKRKSGPEVDAVKIISLSPLQIYSVKLGDFNEDSRCFVHLPLIEGIEALQDEAEVTIIKRSAATCYAVGCVKPVEDTGTLHLNLNPCSHTHSVVNCVTEAEPFILKKAALKALPISEIIKQQICALVTKPEEHLVQRITKNTMVVKCIADDLHPLGYLHFSIFEPGKNARKFKILCGCQPQLTKPVVPREKQLCLHFYMCVCAFASNSKLLEEFKPVVQSVMIKSSGNIQLTVDLPTFDCELGDHKEFFMDDVLYPAAKRRKNNPISSEAELLFNENGAIVKQLKKVNSVEVKKKSSVLDAPLSETATSITFEQWLASVTEQINQTMHYQFNGFPDPLVFHVPQVFFDVLQKRLSVGAKKKRLPNSVVGFCTKDSLPLGVFSKYTWVFNNVLHVKRIFDTPLVPLEVTRSFIENRDGTYVPYQPLKDDEEAQSYRKTMNNFLIKPLEFKTFLKVGNMTQDQKEPTPFIIEWIPDILPKTRVGELRIKFQYGHERNGILEHRNTAQNGTRTENIIQDIQSQEGSNVAN